MLSRRSRRVTNSTSFQIVAFALVLVAFSPFAAVLAPPQIVAVSADREWKQFNSGGFAANWARSRLAHVHVAIYRAHPEIGAAAVVLSPAVMACAVSGKPSPMTTPAESRVLLQEFAMLIFGPQYANPEEVAHAMGPVHPAVLLADDCLITTGATAEEAFGRMEIAEFTARSALAAHASAENVTLDNERFREPREVT